MITTVAVIFAIAAFSFLQIQAKQESARAAEEAAVQRLPYAVYAFPSRPFRRLAGGGRQRKRGGGGHLMRLSLNKKTCQSLSKDDGSN